MFGCLWVYYSEGKESERNGDTPFMYKLINVLYILSVMWRVHELDRMEIILLIFNNMVTAVSVQLSVLEGKIVARELPD